VYNIVKDSLFQPKSIIKYRNKSGWFAFFYLLILTVFMSIGGAVFYLGFQGNTTISTETTGCDLAVASVVCDEASHINTDKYQLYGYSVFFLDETGVVSDVSTLMDDASIVVQGNSLDFYLSGKFFSTLRPFSSLPDTMTFDRYFANISTAVLIGSILITFLGNLFLLVFVSLVSTIPFFRLKKYIRFKVIYKLVIFAITPIAFLMTFYNLLDLPEFLFFILMLIGYRSVFLLQRELYYQTMLHLQENASDTVEASYKVTDEEKDSDSDTDEDE